MNCYPIHGQISRNLPDNKLTGKTGMILNVLTCLEYRRMGYAAVAMNLLIEKARQQDLSYIELSASELGKLLYKKLGFQESESSHFTQMKMFL